jgi:hypothetical protein
MDVFDTFVKTQVAVTVWRISGSSIPLVYMLLFFLSQYHAVFITMSLKYNLKSSIMIPPALLFLLRTILTIQGLLWLHMNFRIDFSKSVMNIIGILMEIA